MTAKTGQEAWRKDGWHRDPARFEMTYVFIPERAAKLVENEKAWKSSFYQWRKAGGGMTACVYATADELDVLTAAFEKFDSADAKLGIARIKECREWQGPAITSIKGGYPVRAKVEKVEAPASTSDGIAELLTIATKKPRAAKPAATKAPRKTSANPRTQARRMVNRVIKNAVASKAIRPATPDETAAVEALLDKA